MTGRPSAQGDLLALVVDTHRPDEHEQPTIFDALEGARPA